MVIGNHPRMNCRTLFASLYKVVVFRRFLMFFDMGSRTLIKYQNKESGWPIGNGHLFLSKIHFSREKSCKKIHDLRFCPVMQ